MSLEVILMFWFEFLRILVKNRKNERTRKTGHPEPLSRSEGHPRLSEVLRRSEGLPCRGEAEAQKGHPPPPPPPPEFAKASPCYAAAKALFIEAKNFGFCSESLVFVHR